MKRFLHEKSGFWGSSATLVLALCFCAVGRCFALCPEAPDESVDCSTPDTPCGGALIERPGQGGCRGEFVHTFLGLPFSLVWSSRGQIDVDEGVGLGVLAPWSHAVQVAGGGGLRLREINGSVEAFDETATPGTFLSSIGSRSIIETVAGGYRLTKVDGEKREFTKTVGDWSYLTSATDRNGRRLELDWGATLPTVIRDVSSGREIQLASSGGRVDSITDSRGAVYSLGYTDGHLTSIGSPDGTTQQIGWMGDGSHLLKSFRDPTTQTSGSLVFFTNGVLKRLQFGGMTTEYAYPDTSTVTVRSLNGAGAQVRVERIEFNGGFTYRRLVGSGAAADPLDASTLVLAEKSEFDAAGRLVKRWDDLGLLTEYFYRSDEQCTAGASDPAYEDMEPSCIRRPTGGSEKFDRDPGSGAPTRIRLFSPSEALVSTSEYTYSGTQSPLTESTVNASDSSVQETVVTSYRTGSAQPTSRSFTRVEKFSYDGNGRVQSIVSPERTLTIEYAAAGYVSALTSNGERSEFSETVNSTTGAVTRNFSVEGATGTRVLSMDGLQQTESVAGGEGGASRFYTDTVEISSGGVVALSEFELRGAGNAAFKQAAQSDVPALTDGAVSRNLHAYPAGKP